MSLVEREEWTRSQKFAFPFIQEAVEQGLSATAALQQFRNAGGSIRNQYWYDLYRDTASYAETADRILAMPDAYTVPETFYQPVDWDTREKYLYRVNVEGTLRDTQDRVSKWVTVESMEPLTKGEIIGQIPSVQYGTLGSPLMDDIEVTDISAIVSNRW